MVLDTRFAWGCSGNGTKQYTTHFEDDFGNVQTRQINRPHISHFLDELLPLIDEHNKQRQSILSLEKCWPTRDCWFRLLVTVTGMSVVDFHRVYRNIKLGETGSNGDEVDAVEIRKFSDLLCGSLVRRKQRGADTLTQFNQQATAGCTGPRLERIVAEDGSKSREVTAKQSAKSGRNVATARAMTCFICRGYLLADGTTDYKGTAFCCSECKMPLCKKDRTEGCMGRTSTCLEDHLASEHDVIGCYPPRDKSAEYPKEKVVSLHPRRSNRR